MAKCLAWLMPLLAHLADLLTIWQALRDLIPLRSKKPAPERYSSDEELEIVEPNGTTIRYRKKLRFNRG